MHTVDMGWREAIVEVLKQSDESLHYSVIAQTIIDEGYRHNVGATPAATVSSVLSTSLSQDGNYSPFIKVSRGFYSLRDKSGAPQVSTAKDEDEAADDAEQMGLINAFGMFWHRSEVHWDAGKPRILGVQQPGSTPIDFAEQAGVYLLYDSDRTIYVGRVTKPRLGIRLWEHTRDRLSGRWDRFSWFGVRTVNSEGKLTPVPTGGIAVANLIATMEALLIEGLEPPQNRRQGDGFNAVEFIQEIDPKLAAQRKRKLLEEMFENWASMKS